jgi:hypothetical protein
MITMGTESGYGCTACHGWKWAGQQPGYDHIHVALALPDDSRSTDTHQVTRGYAVGFAGVSASDRGLPQTWVFFEHLEPAIVFGRAGRMSACDISGFGVYEAAREVRFDLSESDEEIITLYVTGHALDRLPGEDEIFARWAGGVRLESVHYETPALLP